MTGQAQRILQVIRDAVDSHEPPGGMAQWYVDEFTIDCDAGEFWHVAEEALEQGVRDAVPGPVRGREGDGGG